MNLVLEGEDPGRVAGAIANKRIWEYYRQLWKGRRGMTPFQAWFLLDEEKRERL